MCCTVYSLEMCLLKAKKERDESNMLSCSVHTTVTLKWRISACVRRRVARAHAAAQDQTETPVCHENQDYLNLLLM